MSTKIFYISSLDGIRALAFLVVFVAHSGAKTFIPGGFGVTVFFFLSGYLITTLLRIEYDKTKSVNLTKFYLKRLLRIFPPFIIAVFIGLLLTQIGILERPVHFKDMLFLIFQCHNYAALLGYNNIPLGTGIYWSLAVEEHFYLLFPLLFLWLMKRFNTQKTSWYLAGICLVILAWRIFLVATVDDYEERIYKSSDTRMDSLLFGCIMAIGLNPKLDMVRLSKKNLLVMVFASIVILLLTFLIREDYFRESIRYTLQGIALFPLFYYAIRYNQDFFTKWLNGSFIKHIGVLSYNLYLLHFMFLLVAQKYFPDAKILSSIIALVLSMAVAKVIHYAIEQPLMRLRRKIG